MERRPVAEKITFRTVKRNKLNRIRDLHFDVAQGLMTLALVCLLFLLRVLKLGRSTEVMDIVVDERQIPNNAPKMKT
jgi:hypothetical protein